MINPWLGMALLLAVFGALMAALRAHGRRRSPDPELMRKLLHVGMGLLSLALPWLFRAAWPVLLVTALFVAVLTALRLSAGMRRCLGGVIDGVARESVGEICFAPGVALVFLLSGGDPLRFCIPVLILSLADAAAALVGARYGLTRYTVPGGQKSVEGSVACLTVAFLSAQIPLLLFADIGRGATVLVALTLALSVTLIEAVGWRGSDNLLIPVGGFVVLDGLLQSDVSALVAALGLSVLLVALFALLSLRRPGLPRARFGHLGRRSCNA